MSDQRKHSRMQVELTVLITLSDGLPLLARAVNLSLGGMQVLHSGSKCPVGTLVRVRIGDGASALRLRGTVRWTAPDGFGLQFASLSEREIQALLELVRSARVSTP